MINRKFLKWFDERMGYLTTGVRLVHTAEQLAKSNRESGFSPTTEAENYHDTYVVRTRAHRYFNELRKWYVSGRKRFSDDIEPTPRIVRLWYASDGYLDVGRWGRPRIEIKAQNERERADFLVSLFKTHGFTPTYSATNFDSPVTTRSDWSTGWVTRLLDSNTSGQSALANATAN